MTHCLLSWPSFSHMVSEIHARMTWIECCYLRTVKPEKCNWHFRNTAGLEEVNLHYLVIIQIINTYPCQWILETCLAVWCTFSSRWNETRSATSSEIKLLVLQNATTWFLGQGKLNHHDTEHYGLQKQSYHKPGNILYLFDFSIDCYEWYRSFINKSTKLLYLKPSQWSINFLLFHWVQYYSTDHCFMEKEALSKNGNFSTSMIY